MEDELKKNNATKKQSKSKNNNIFENERRPKYFETGRLSKKNAAKNN